MKLRLWAIVCASFLLSGCFESEKDLLENHAKKIPIAESGQYFTCALNRGPLRDNENCEVGQDIEQLHKLQGEFHVCHKLADGIEDLKRRGYAPSNSKKCYPTSITINDAETFSVSRSGPEGSERGFDFRISNKKVQSGAFADLNLASRCSKRSGECNYVAIESFATSSGKILRAHLIPPQCKSANSCKVSSYEELMAGVEESTAMRLHGVHVIFEAGFYNWLVRESFVTK